jgi:regulator of cell morphogenesis and NO signaling
MIDIHFQVSEMVYERPGLLLVLERLGIYPGLEDKTIEELAKEHHINPELLLLLIKMQLEPDKTPDIVIPLSDISIILRYLSISHDYYTEELYPHIASQIESLTRQNQSASMQMVKQFFDEYRAEADKHFEYENNIAFPYILTLIENNKLPEDLSEEYSVDIYKDNHDNIEEKLDDLKHLLIKYLPADENYKIRRNIMLTLHRLDADLTAHAKIEDEVLIPLVKKLEEKNRQA